MPPHPNLPDRTQFGNLFAGLYGEKNTADGVVIRADGRLEALRPFRTANEIPPRLPPQGWWEYIYDEAQKGRFGHDGLVKLLQAAADEYPGNDKLERWLTEDALPDNRAVDAAVVVEVGDGFPTDKLQHLANLLFEFARTQQVAIRFNATRPGSENLYFSIKNGTEEQINRFIERARTVLSEQGMQGAVRREPYAFRDYYADPVTVEGPDGQRFALDQVPASTVVGDVARTLMNDYQSSLGAAAAGQGGRQQAVVDLMNADGSARRLDPRLTLHDAGVRPGAVLRVHPERTAGAVNPLMREEALARVRMQVVDYAAANPGFGVTANSPVAPTEFLFSFDVAGFAPPAQAGGPPHLITHHEVMVYLPADFPLKAPEAWWQTDIFHPNIDRKSGWVCLGPLQEFYKPGLDFGELCQMLVDIAGYRLYSAEPGNFLDAEASVWAHSPAGQMAIEAAGGISILGRLVFEGRPERELRLRRLKQ